MRAISKAAFARERGVDPSRVTQWLRDGRVVEIAGGKIDADVAHATLDATLDQTKGVRRRGNITSSAPADMITSTVSDDGSARVASDLSSTDSANVVASAAANADAGADAASGVAADVMPAAASPAAASAAIKPSPAAALLAPGNPVSVAGGGSDSVVSVVDRGGARGSGAAADDSDASDTPTANESVRADTDYWVSKARREKAEATRAELRALEEAKALVSAADVAREGREQARQIRNALCAIPDRVAPILDPANPARAHKLLTDEIHKALRELRLRLAHTAADVAHTGAAERADVTV